MKKITRAEKNKILKECILEDFYRYRNDFDSICYRNATRNCLKSLEFEHAWFEYEMIAAQNFFIEKYIVENNKEKRKLTLDEAKIILDEKYPS